MGVGGWLVNRRLMRHEFELEKKMNDVCGEELKRKEEEQKKYCTQRAMMMSVGKYACPFFFILIYLFQKKKPPFVSFYVFDLFN